MKTAKLINQIIALILFPVGAYLIWKFSSWQLFLGIFLFIWANNIRVKGEDK